MASKKNKNDEAYEAGVKAGQQADKSDEFAHNLVKGIHLGDTPTTEYYKKGWEYGIRHKPDPSRETDERHQYTGESRSTHREVGLSDDSANVLGKLLAYLIVGGLILWFVFASAIPLLIIDVAIIALAIGVINKDWKAVAFPISAMGATYVVADFNQGWFTKGLVTNVAFFAHVTPVLLCVNVGAGMVAGYLMLTHVMNAKYPLADERVTVRNVLTGIGLFLIAAVAIGTQDLSGSGNARFIARPSTVISQNQVQQVTQDPTATADPVGDVLPAQTGGVFSWRSQLGNDYPVPDIVSAKGTVTDSELTIIVQVAPGTFDPARTMFYASIDSDGDSGTGSKYLQAGIDFTLEFGGTMFNSDANLRSYSSSGAQANSQRLRNSPVVTDNGFAISVPLRSLHANANSPLRFFITTDIQLEANTSTVILDAIPGGVTPAGWITAISESTRQQQSNGVEQVSQRDSSANGVSAADGGIKREGRQPSAEEEAFAISVFNSIQKDDFTSLVSLLPKPPFTISAQSIGKAVSVDVDLNAFQQLTDNLRAGLASVRAQMTAEGILPGDASLAGADVTNNSAGSSAINIFLVLKTSKSGSYRIRIEDCLLVGNKYLPEQLKWQN